MISPKYTGWALFVVLLPLTTYGAVVLSEWRSVKTIQVPTLSQSTYVKVPLDREVAAGTKAFTDIRIVSSGTEVPYQLLTERGSQTASDFYGSNWSDLSTRNGTVSFSMDLKEAGLLHNQLSIRFAPGNFKRAVSVYGADEALAIDSRRWRLLSSQGHIYAFRDDVAGYDTASGIVRYPDSTVRYLKVVIGAGEGDVPSVESASVYRHAISAARTVKMIVPLMLTSNAAEKSTELVADLGTTGVPSDRLDLLAAGTGNFNRRVTIQSSNDGVTWRLRAQGYIFQLKTPKFSGQNLSLQFPETTDRYLRVVVFNEDNEPVDFVPTAHVFGVGRSLVFEAAPGKTYELYYGQAEARAPRYDLVRYFAYLDTEALPEAKLGVARANDAYVPTVPKPAPFTERYGILLNILLVIIVLFLAGLTAWYVHKLRKGEGKYSDEGPEGPVNS